MNSYPEPQTDAEPQLAPVVYEQPLNERMRTFLRLEFLYTQATYHSELENAWSARAAVSSLLEILAITARGDCRSDVLKELERHVGVLKEYQSKTGVDPSRLKSLDVEPSEAARGLVDGGRRTSWRPCATRNS